MNSSVENPASSLSSNRTLLFFVALLFLVGGGTILYYGYRKFQKRDAEVKKIVSKPDPKTALPKGPVESFVLTDRSGNEFASADLKGKVWVASFFFSSCPHSCKQQNESIRDLHRIFAKRGVTFLSITCDPKNDTAATLRDYAMNFTSDVRQWKFLTGDLEYIQKVGAERFRVFVGEKGHQDRLLVVDKWGRMRASVPWSRPGELAKMRTLLEELLAETEPPKDEPESVKKRTKIFDENGRLIKDGDQ